MPYVAPEVVQRVKQIDLLTYLKNYEPYELVHFSGNTYSTRTHDKNLQYIAGWFSRKEDHPAIFMPYVELDVVRRVKQIDWLTYVIQKSQNLRIIISLEKIVCIHRQKEVW